ncbi:MAG: orotate phosphoribosyltransferase [Deferribacteraceae bacterium]|jgi:orotate phosphoribosyltransferase|nr:orotate phosphoribosyltransferase [Deferribacteraceae bacterium]
MNEVISIYEKTEGLLRGHFLLSSGLHSDTYLQSEKVMMYPETSAKVIAPLVGKLAEIEFDTVVSPAIGGIRFGYELARQLNKRTIFTERVDNNMTLRRGFELAKGEMVIIAEDVVTTGKSTRECMAAVEACGAIVVAVVSIIDRSGGEAGFTVPFIPLAAVDVKTWSVDECPMCKAGGVAVKPGSRK